MIKKITFLFILTLFLGACDPSKSIFKPVPRNMMESLLDKKPKFEGPNKDIYNIAWDHGCESGITTYGGDIYKSFYKFKRDSQLAKNPIYSVVWKDSYNYCRHWTSRALRYGGLYAGNKKGAKDWDNFDGILSSTSFGNEIKGGYKLLPQHGAINYWGYSDQTGGLFSTPDSSSSTFYNSDGSFWYPGGGMFDNHAATKNKTFFSF